MQTGTKQLYEPFNAASVLFYFLARLHVVGLYIRRPCSTDCRTVADIELR